MSKIKRQAANILSLTNLCFGIFAILLLSSTKHFNELALEHSIHTSFYVASGFIILSVLSDFFDGRVARKFNTISDFGKQIDSICDMTSFGIAPAVLIWRINSLLDITSPYLYIVKLIPPVMFALCGAIRLAKFNTQEDKSFFLGIPIPLAALAIIILSFPSIYVITRNPESNLIPLVINFIVILISYSMVSKVKIPKL